MREPPARGNGSLDFLFCRADESSIDSRRSLYRIDTGIEIDRRQESVNERAEAPTAWPFFAASTLHHIHDNVRPVTRSACCFVRIDFGRRSLSRRRTGQ